MDLPLDVSLLTELISRLLSSASSTSGFPPKQAPKTDTLATFSLLAEILASKTLPTSIDLVVRLIESLNNVLQIAPTVQSDLSYVQQLLMLAIENVADKITDVPNAVPSSIRLDVLVEVVRVARNPQTFHQALMLIAGLTRLAPDSVLHNVMPIFTFMGSNIFHRDDEYSFRVVQKTIDSIVPVMASSLKEKHDGLGLYINARDFLRVFTEASSHIPRHRRTNFFIHLVDVLGANIFLPPVTMFLATKSLRSRGQTEESAFSLANSIVHHYDPDLQTTTLVEALKESQRLLQAYVDPSAVAFLADPSDDESNVFLTRAQLLISFVGQCAKAHSASATSSASTTELVHILISLAQVKHPEDHVHFEDIRRSAKDSLNRFLTVVPAVDFISAALAMLQSSDSEIHDGALELLAERLGHISDSVRRQNSSIFIHIISHIKTILNLNQTNLSLSGSCLKALQVIAQSTCEGEESALTSVVPLLILIVRARTLGQASVSVISSLVPKLGPRMIPFFRELVTEIVALIRHAGVNSASVEALRSLVTTIPTFWSSNELVQVISFHVDTNNSNDPRHSPTTGLIISLAKRIPSRALLSALIDFWSMPGRTQWEESAVVALFDVVKRALHVAVKNDVVDLTKPLFKMFLSAFEAVINEAVDQSDGEGAVISAFMELVIKLNDSAFRPLFRRLYDWAFAEDSDTSRRITFLHNYIALLDFFKSLMTPYMSFLLPPFITSLKQSDTDDSTLNYRLCLVKTITKSLMLDDGAFWRDDKLRQVAQPLIQQLPTFAAVASPIAHSALSDCLAALGDCTTDDTLLKNLNIDVLMHTRSENSKVRIEALQCSASLWHAIGGKLLGFVPETTTFIAECAEDEHDLVVEEARNLKNAVESVAGRIDV
ncbi:hypothetical protein ONZ45_g764 [Pleurotus djamor]|nr:hypothetical protein ONZ45_g764 [Pleurotus djamor]